MIRSGIFALASRAVGLGIEKSMWTPTPAILSRREDGRSPRFLRWLGTVFRRNPKQTRQQTPCTPPLAVPRSSPRTGLTDDEKLMIVRATRNCGTWYMCEKRHPYLVTECGKPMQTAACPVCGAAIGRGLKCRLLKSNRDASSLFSARGVV